MKVKGEMEVRFDAKSENEGFARVVIAAFVTQLDPTLDEIEDIKTAVSEAVTNAIIHGYENKDGKITIVCQIEENEIYIEVSDLGSGIADVEKAMQPMFTTKPELDRSGMGFVFMEAFMDEVKVESQIGIGTTVKLRKRIGVQKYTWTT